MSTAQRAGASIVLASLLGLAWNQAAHRAPAPATGVSRALDQAVQPVSGVLPETCPYWTVASDQGAALFGNRVAAAGDVNGDGYGDVIVGAPSYDNGEANEGRAHLYLGSPSGPSGSPVWTAESDQGDTSFGVAASSAGDVDGDGYGDVIVGAPYYNNGQINEGQVYVYLGSASGLATSPAWTAESNQPNAYFGLRATGAGDVDGDGYDDVIVGAPSYSNGEADEGRAYVYLGSATGLAAAPAWTAEANDVEAEFGWGAAGAGDVNGDGYEDVIVGAPLFGSGDHGRAFVYHGSATGLSTTAGWMVGGANFLNHFGASVDGAGDVDGDGYHDVVVGEPWADAGALGYAGGAYLYLGSVGGLSTAAAWSIEGEEDHGFLGSGISKAGDVNADGKGDWIVESMGAGPVFLYFGSGGALSTCPAWTDTSLPLPWIVSREAGDVNGDGYDDVLVGKHAFSIDPGDHVELYLGSISGIARAAVFAGDGINADTITPMNVTLGSSWSAPLLLGHKHGWGGVLSLTIRSTPINGPNFVSAFGGRPTELLVGGTFLARIAGTHDGGSGDIPPQPIPYELSFLGATWAAQYTVVGGDYADLSQAVYGVVVEQCP